MGLRELLLGGPSTMKASGAVGAIVSLVQGQEAVYSKRDFQSLASNGFERNVYVYRGVMTIATAISGIPLSATKKSDRSVPVTSHPLLDLLDAPNGEQGYGEWIESLVAFWILAGNNYTQSIGPSSGPNKGMPQELWNLRPDRMKVRPDPKNRIGGYRYDAGSARQDFTLEEILHMRMFAATDDWYGLSPVAVAANVVDQMNSGNDWNTALLQNFSRPPIAIVASGALSDQQFTRLQAEIKKSYMGGKNAGKPPLLEGGIDIKKISESPSDMDWLGGKSSAGRDIAIALGVPSELLGDAANKTYSNVQEAYKFLYKDTVLPVMDKLMFKLNRWLPPKFGDRWSDIMLAYDKDGIEALQEDRKLLVDRLNQAWWLTINQRLAAMGMPLLPPEQGDVIMVPSGMITLEDALAQLGSMAEPPAPTPIAGTAPAA